MGSYLGIIVETGARADFWSVAQTHRIEPLGPALEIVPATVLIMQADGTSPDWESIPKLAGALSASLGTSCLGLVAQTAATVLEVHAFHRGDATRVLAHADGSWGRVEGTPQPWEPALLFEDVEDIALADRQGWPGVLGDEVSADDIARYRAARRDGDPARVLDLIMPDHLGPIERVCRYFGLDMVHPAGHWLSRQKRSFFRFLSGR